MPVKLLRQTLILLIAAAYIGATMLQAAPSFAASSETHHAAMGGTTDHRDQPGNKMPCKGMPPGCVTDLGCIFLVSLPAPDLTFASVTEWSSVSYDNRIARIARAHDQARPRTSHRVRLTGAGRRLPAPSSFIAHL